MNRSMAIQRNETPIDEVAPVLIIGGGLSGLATALFLAAQGVQPMLVEKHPALLTHPRARGFTQRSVEIFRQIGLEPAIREASFAGGDAFRWVAVTAETLAGEHHPVVEAEDTMETLTALSPAPFAPIDQDRLEIILRTRAADLGADIRFATELVSFSNQDDAVTARLRDRQSGREYTVRARYLVAADGWDSPIRARLGIPVDGPGPFFHILTAMIDADLNPALAGREISIAYLNQPRRGTVLMAHDQIGKRWVFATGYAPDHGESATDVDDARIGDMVRDAAGLSDTPVTLRPQIPGTDLKVLGFAIGAQVARDYRSGNVFLVGDAAHIVPPTGGLGANTGIQDAHHLAWKLALVLDGRANPALLDTYHAERHPVGAFTMGQSLARWASRVGAGPDESTPEIMSYAAVTFGYRYRSTAVDGASADALALSPSGLNGQPGTRAPHLWLCKGREPVSTIDLFGHDFVLLAGRAGHAWTNAVATNTLGAVTAYRIGDDSEVSDPSGAWEAAYGISPAGAVLVRPDGFVAWREHGYVDDPVSTLRGALQRILGFAAAKP
ncbi:MAG: FAD-dependent monooxygenase [Thermomicrobiales bacterium]